MHGRHPEATERSLRSFCRRVELHAVRVRFRPGGDEFPFLAEPGAANRRPLGTSKIFATQESDISLHHSEARNSRHTQSSPVPRRGTLSLGRWDDAADSKMRGALSAGVAGDLQSQKSFCHLGPQMSSIPARLPADTSPRHADKFLRGKPESSRKRHGGARCFDHG